MLKKLVIFLGIFFMCINGAFAKIKTQTIEYNLGDKKFEGYLAFDDAKKGMRPGIVLFHNWLGISEETKSKAADYAKLGLVVFLGDIYGKGIRPTNPKDAGELATKYKNDRKLLREHVTAALDELKKQKNVDLTKLFAGGFCFGGTSALELGRSGADLKGIFSFHGGLSNPTPLDAKNFKGKVFVFHGAIDPFVPKTEVDQFVAEMNEAKVDYEFVAFANTVHSFTDSTAGSDISKGAAYNKSADAESFTITKNYILKK
jgi:dienelactone hydrolase